MSPELSAKVRRNSSQNERLWQILDIGTAFGPTFSLKNSQQFQLDKIIEKLQSSLFLSY